MIERIVHEDRELATILRRSHRPQGIEFLTSEDSSLQLGCMSRPAGHVIAPHVHQPVPREVCYTQEVLFIRSGRVRIDFYGDAQDYLESTVLEAGDVILLAVGGHGLEMIEPSDIVEAKQGPYVGDHDKTRFSPVGPEQLRFRGEPS
ncbi:MAG: hypothetical protein CFE40_13255 [Burkholderiales bacterium PBB1]|nr:MAG: hypothetical protein CFE40_13255 [Burkholderiales bacterium PBB1]